jgi:energy-coupling factor transporter ATP-binding protein EcfA2
MFVDAVPNERFVLDKKGRFEYYGREKFRELYDAAKSMDFRGTRKYFLHGTLGAGKSYLLAALACVLNKEGVKVIYLPDCREMMGDAFEYLRSALRLAFTRSTQRDAFLARCKDTQGLLDFCSSASSEVRLLFIVDQVNSLDPTDETTDRFRLEMKRNVRTILDTITAKHMKISSSSGNYLHALHDIHRQTGEKRLHLYGGLNEVKFFQTQYLQLYTNKL